MILPPVLNTAGKKKCVVCNEQNGERRGDDDQDDGDHDDGNDNGDDNDCVSDQQA